MGESTNGRREDQTVCLGACTKVRRKAFPICLVTFLMTLVESHKFEAKLEPISGIDGQDHCDGRNGASQTAITVVSRRQFSIPDRRNNQTDSQYGNGHSTNRITIRIFATNS